MTIHEAIKTAREHSGLTAQELAREMGYQGKTAYSNVTKYEKGENNPGKNIIERFADATRCRIYFDPIEGWGVDRLKSVETVDHGE